MLIVASSIATPLILKVLFKKYPNEPLDEDKIGAIDTVVKANAAMSEVREFLDGVDVKNIEVKARSQREAMQKSQQKVDDKGSTSSDKPTENK